MASIIRDSIRPGNGKIPPHIGVLDDLEETSPLQEFIIHEHKKSNPEEYQEHVNTWLGFTHLVKWFVLHALIDLAGIYFFIVHRNILAGFFLIGIGTATLIWGIATLPKATRTEMVNALIEQLKGG